MYEIRTCIPYGNRFYITKSKGGINPCIVGKVSQTLADALANCVGYACGRYAESYYQQTGEEKMWALSCNAKNLLERAKALGLKVSYNEDEVVRGAMVVFVGTYYGHVLFAEDKNDNGTFLTSESNWDGTPFIHRTRDPKDNWNFGKGLKFLGFVYPEVEMTLEEKEEPKQLGKVYKTLYNVVVRTGPGTNYRRKKLSELTNNARKVATSSGCIKSGVEVSNLETGKDLKGNVWMRIPSGWIPFIYDGDICLDMVE